MSKNEVGDWKQVETEIVSGKFIDERVTTSFDSDILAPTLKSKQTKADLRVNVNFVWLDDLKLKSSNNYSTEVYSFHWR